MGTDGGWGRGASSLVGVARNDFFSGALCEHQNFPAFFFLGLEGCWLCLAGNDPSYIRTGVVVDSLSLY